MWYVAREVPRNSPLDFFLCWPWLPGYCHQRTRMCSQEETIYSLLPGKNPMVGESRSSWKLSDRILCIHHCQERRVHVRTRLKCVKPARVGLEQVLLIYFHLHLQIRNQRSQRGDNTEHLAGRGRYGLLTVSMARALDQESRLLLEPWFAPRITHSAVSSPWSLLPLL